MQASLNSGLYLHRGNLLGQGKSTPAGVLASMQVLALMPPIVTTRVRVAETQAIAALEQAKQLLVSPDFRGDETVQVPYVRCIDLVNSSAMGHHAQRAGIEEDDAVHGNRIRCDE